MFTWLLRLLLALAILVLLSLGVVAAIEPEFDLSDQRTWVSARLSGLAGREVRIDGDIRLALGRRMRLAVTAVRVAAPPWAQSEDLLRAREVSFGVELPALLGGVVHIGSAVLRDAEIFLEVGPDGARSWDFAPRRADRDEAAWHRTVVLEDLAAGDVGLHYRQPQRPPLHLQLDRLDQHNAAGMLELAALGRVNDLALQVDGRVGPLDALLAGRDIAVDLAGRLNQTSVTAHGRFGRPAELEDIDLAATLRGPSLSPLLDALGIPHERGGDVDLRINVTDRDRGFSWQSSGHVGPFRLDTHGVLERPLALDGLHATVWAAGHDLSVLGRVFGVAGLPAVAYRLNGEVLRNAKGLVVRGLAFEAAQTRLALEGRVPNFPDVGGADATLSLHAPRPAEYASPFGLAGPLPGPLQVEARLGARGERAAQLDIALELGAHRASVSGPLGVQPDAAATNLAFEFAGPALAEPLAALGFAAAPAGSYRFAGRVRGRPEHGLALQLSEGRIGATRVTADGALGTRPRFDDANLAVALRGPSLAAAAAGLTDVALPDLPFAVEARLLGDLRAPSVGNLAASVGQTRLDTHGRTGWPPGFADTDLRFLLQIADPAELAPALADSAWRGRPLRVRGVLRRSGNGFALRDGALESEGLHADFSAGLPAGPGLAGLSVELTAAGPDLGLLLPGSTHDRLAELPFRAEAVVHAGAPEPDITLSADGGVWQALAAGLHGRALLRGGPGRVWNPGMQRAPGSFPSRLIAKLIPFAPEPYTLVECGAVAVGAADGVVRLDPGLVLRTPEVDVTLTGSIDLNSESIDLQASNAVRQGIDPSAAGLVERLVEVGGTLGEPRIVLDAPKALASGSAAGTVGRPTPVARELLDRVAAAAANPCTAVGESVETDGIEPLGETSPPGAAL